MPNLVKFASTSNLIRFTIKDKTTGQGKTGLSSATTGLVISTICDNEASATAYTQAGGTIQTITTLGTYAAPSASNCRFKEVDSTNHKGLYEFQFADARFSVSSSKRLVISVNDGESTLLDADYEIELVQFDPFDAVHLGLSALPNTACTTNASLLTSGTGTDQLSVSAGKVLLQATQTGVTIPTVTTVTNQLTAAQIAAGVWQDAVSGDFTVASSIGKSLYTSGAVPGAASGIAIVGSNMGLSAAGVTSIWTDATGSDFTAASSIGKSLYTSGNAPGAASGIAIVGSNMGLSAGGVSAIWQDTTAGDFTVALSIGKSIMNGVSLGTGLTVNSLTNLPAIPNNWLTNAGIANGAISLAKFGSDVQFLPMTTGTAQAGASGSITLASGSSAVNNFYVGQTVVITGGTGAGESQLITGYVGSTKVATTAGTWATTPDNTSTYSIVPLGAASVAGTVTLAASQPNYAPAKAGDKMDIVDTPSAVGAAALAGYVWDVALSSHLTAGSTGAFLNSVPTVGSGAGQINLNGGGVFLAAAGADTVLIESGITPSASLTNDANTQLASINMRQALAIIASSCCAVLAGSVLSGGTTVTTKPAGNSAGNTRLNVTTDSNNNRTAVTTKVPT